MTGRRGRPVVGAMAAIAVAALVTGACSSGSSGGGKAAGPPTTDVTGQAPGAPATHDVQFANGDMLLDGTFTSPVAGRGPVPGVLFVPDVGPGTRDGPISPEGEPDTIAADLSQSFVNAGMATLRYDRRGTGESKPAPSSTAGPTTTVPPTSFSFEDLVADAKAGLDLLGERKETAGSKLAVVGYGDGGLVALRLAETDPHVSRLILISTPGRQLADVQAGRLDALYGSVSGDAVHAAVDGMLATGTLPPLESLRTELRPLLPQDQIPLLTELYRLDPASEAAKVTVPVLDANGSASTGAGAADAAAFIQVLGSKLEVIVAANSDENLDQVLPPPADDPSDPNSVDHVHGAASPSTVGPRDPATISTMTMWLSRGVA